MVIEEIAKWASSQSGWKNEALRRIWEKGELNRQDLRDILSILKAEHGLTTKGTPVTTLRPVTKGDISVPTSGGPSVILQAMHSLKNVNVLAVNQKIEFGLRGITVIYGGTAAGKSGYSRVLKLACRARGEKDRILPNVLSTQSNPEPAEAVFDLQYDGKADSVKWIDGLESPGLLSELAVFDAKAARVYVDEANEVVYIPYGLDALTKLATACDSIRELIQQEISNLGSPPTIISEIVGDGKILPELKFNTPKKPIERLANFTDQDEKCAKMLEKEVADLIANDPVEKARTIRRDKSRIDQFRLRLQDVCRSLSTKQIRKLKDLWQDAETAKQAAFLASQAAFGSEPLPGVGGDTWRTMFEAAMRYSESTAYPHTPFPVIDKNSRCVLCQQPLADDAKDRLQRFWKFIQDDTAKTASEKRQLFDNALSANSNLDLDFGAKDSILLDEIYEFSPSAQDLFGSFFQALRERQTAVGKASKSGDWANVPRLPKSPSGILSQFAKAKEREARKLDEVAKPDEKVRKELELNHLKMRRKLSEQKAEVLGYIDRLNLEIQLRKCYDAAVTTGITRKQSELMEQAVTKEFRELLGTELTALGAGHIKLNLKRTGSIGSTFLQLELPVGNIPNVIINEVLSDGEQRAVAIASFLAELKTAPSRCGIIFDDPVSSLDHIWREKVAKRLVEEAKERQVIIFTHDIVFLLALEHEARVQQVPMKNQTLMRVGNAAGICDQELPWLAMTVEKRIRHLNKLLQEAKALYGRNKIADYEKEVRHCYGLLREAWERAVEELIFGDVVQRFRQGVETQKLIGVAVTDLDYLTVYRAMEKCSRWLAGHDEAAASGAILPVPDELAKDIKELESFVDVLKKHQDETKVKRKALLKPPP